MARCETKYDLYTRRFYKFATTEDWRYLFDRFEQTRRQYLQNYPNKTKLDRCVEEYILMFDPAKQLCYGCCQVCPTLSSSMNRFMVNEIFDSIKDGENKKVQVQWREIEQLIII